jgi:hypothetical protein
VILTALTTRLGLELTYREHHPEVAAQSATANGHAIEPDRLSLMDSGDNVKLLGLPVF